MATPTPARTPKSQRTREALIRAGRDVFSRVGFSEATISDITAAAQLAHGTFYTHFDSKEQIFLTVLGEVTAEGFHLTSVRQDIGATSTPAARIELTNRRYLAAYRDSARILASFEALAAGDEVMAGFRRSVRHAYISRTVTSIRRWQDEGLVAPSLDAECVANCLGSMVERVAHMQYVFGDGCGDEDRLVAALTHVWLAALGLEDDR